MITFIYSFNTKNYFLTYNWNGNINWQTISLWDRYWYLVCCLDCIILGGEETWIRTRIDFTPPMICLDQKKNDLGLKVCYEVRISKFPVFQLEQPLKSDFWLRKTDAPHHSQPQYPRWLLCDSTAVNAVKYMFISTSDFLSLAHSTVQLLYVNKFLWCWYL